MNCFTGPRKSLQKQYEAEQLAAVTGRRAVNPIQTEITRLGAVLSLARMEVAISASG
jgi:hypothetical protein